MIFDSVSFTGGGKDPLQCLIVGGPEELTDELSELNLRDLGGGHSKTRRRINCKRDKNEKSGASE
ncbi:unnamed protein product [Prunus armeniaca]